MSIKSDKWIRRMAEGHGMIEPFEPGQVKHAADGHRIVSYGTSSYGYDVRCAREFKIFTNINSTIVDPKAFDPSSFVDLEADVCIIPPNSFALARTVDHTLLKPEATDADVAALAAEAAELGVYSVCVSPSRLPVQVAGGVKVCAVVGFPSGAHESEVKAAEAALAVRRGAGEIDMVVDLGRVVAGDWGAVEKDIAAVRAACGSALLKVILETAALAPEQITEGCRRSEAAGAGYVKTSTGFHPAGGATPEAVAVMREAVGRRARVKASGGLRTIELVFAVLDAGADRLGLSATAAVLAAVPD